MDDIKFCINQSKRYSKDEVVAFQLQTIRDLQVEIGKLKSSIYELEHELEDFKANKVNLHDLKHKGWVKDLLYTDHMENLKKEIASLKLTLAENQHKDFKKESLKWKEMYFNLIAKHKINING